MLLVLGLVALQLRPAHAPTAMARGVQRVSRSSGEGSYNHEVEALRSQLMADNYDYQQSSAETFLRDGQQHTLATSEPTPLPDRFAIVRNADGARPEQDISYKTFNSTQYRYKTLNNHPKDFFGFGYREVIRRAFEDGNRREARRKMNDHESRSEQGVSCKECNSTQHKNRSILAAIVSRHSNDSEHGVVF